MKKSLLFAAGMALAVMPVVAQRLNQGYVTWPEAGDLATYVKQWNGGAGTIKVNGADWEDANFFISRVKPKTRFVNNDVQVYPGISPYDLTKKEGNDKRVIWWVPCGDPNYNSQATNALADGIFDGEIFDMWSYLDHWGNWTSPYGFVPGNFADVAHKNGVAVSGTAQPAFGGISPSWKASFQALSSSNVSADAVGKFLIYHGSDGLGYNSEWSGYAPVELMALHNSLKTYMADKNPLWEVIWYGGTTDGGSISFDHGVGPGGNNSGIFKGASIFLNYNWNNTSTMATSINYAKEQGVSPFTIYAGMNQQGGEPKSGNTYNLIKDYQYSIGLWGAHQQNMFWQARNAKGSSDAAKANTYLEYVHQWFGNGPMNPAVKMTIKHNGTHHPTADWAGMSSMMSERSSLAWDLKNEPFYTFFNIGNGTFFNWKGERQNNKPWHNIGVQDYQPTWHYWWAKELMGGKEQAGLDPATLKMKAAVTWEDAYVGGSCMKVTGSTDLEYLHLFKTNFALANKDQIVIKFKLLGGKGDLKLVTYGRQSATSDLKSVEYDVFTAEQCEDLEDASYKAGADGWQTATIKITNSNRLGVWNLSALKFENAENLDLLIGGFWVEKSGASFAAPATPTIKTAKVLAYNSGGVDGKLIWNMPNTKAVGEPVYNTDVNTSMFQLWSQQEGEEPVMSGVTTSWAGFVFAAPVNAQGTKRMRFGVKALSLDTKNEGQIAWSDYLTLGDYQTNDNIAINKNIIKPNEKFELSFVDPQHVSAQWSIVDGSGKVLWSANGHTVECPGLANVGGYTVKVTYGGNTMEYANFVPISSEAVGALPEIYTLAMDGVTVDEDDAAVSIELNEQKTFSYTGRNADGSASRGVDLNENWYGVKAEELGLTSNTSFSVAAWVKYNELPAGRSSFITIEDRTGGGWPYNNWGYFWGRINDQGKFVDDVIDTSWGMRVGTGTEGNRIFHRYDDAKINVGAWTHVAIVFEYQAGTSNLRQSFYINGVKQHITQYIAVNKGSFEGACGGHWLDLSVGRNLSGATYAEDIDDAPFVTDAYPLTSGMWIAFGGTSQNITAAKGCVDDFQVWGKAMTQADVLKSMEGLDRNNLPAEVLGYWDFETAANSDNSFPGYTGTNAKNKSPKSYLFHFNSGGENDNSREYDDPSFLTGSPFIAGTAYPVVTKPTWTTRRAEVVGDGTGEEGEATISWAKPGDYEVELTLANGHGEAHRTYPVIKVGEELQGLEGIEVDENGFYTYTIEDALFIEFDNDGAYDVEVYNTAGLLVGKKSLDVLAGQNASIALGTPGIYLVKVVRDGKDVRTVKVVRK